MHRPVCCGRNATPYRRDYGWRGWEEGFRCRVCGRLRLPCFPPGHFPSREDEYDKLRAEGLAFDAATTTTNTKGHQ